MERVLGKGRRWKCDTRRSCKIDVVFVLFTTTVHTIERRRERGEGGKHRGRSLTRDDGIPTVNGQREESPDDKKE